MGYSKKLLEISPNHPVETEGGVERVVLEIIKNLSDEFSTDVLCTGSGSRDIDGGRVYSISTPSYMKQLFFNILQVAFLLRNRKRYDTIHVHGSNGAAAILLSYTGLIDAKTVLTLHGLTVASGIDTKEHYVSHLLQKTSIRYADKTVSVSKGVKQEVESHYGFEDIDVIYNGVDTENFRPIDQEEARKKLDLPLEKDIVLWVGLEKRRKNFDLVLDVVRELDNAILVSTVVEDDSELYHRVGKLKYEEMNYLYNSADVFLFPSKYEAASLVILEAMAAGTPIVCSKASKPELIENGENGFIVGSWGAEEYSEQVRKLLNSEDESADLTRNARRKAQDYGWNNQIRKYEKLMQNI
ncbi:MAG: glycosyltransferase family 4 protein [Candidatus Nanohaloarchaea archaeon]